MFSLKTCIELLYAFEKMDQADVDRFFYACNLQSYLAPPYKPSKQQKVNHLLSYLKEPRNGPFTNSFQIDALQFVVDDFYRKRKKERYYAGNDRPAYEDLFSEEYSELANSLKRDGYVVQERLIRKLLPVEIQEAKTESELIGLLSKHGFDEAREHLDQAVENHRKGQWASANSQFRPYIESLLVSVAKKILPNNVCETGAAAIKLLSATANPPFFLEELNEVSDDKNDIPFVSSLWKRLHPQGSHPGLSDADDSTFRYHMVVIFSHYILKRFDAYINQPKKP